MKVGERLFEVLEALARQGWEEIEVFHKRGRSRTMHYSAYSEATSLRQEEGWAVRAGDRRRSFYYAASGEPRPDAAWPDADGRGLRLPSARPLPPWTAPSTLDTPLLGEAEAHGFFDGLAQELAKEVAGARLLSGYLDDGSSESQLVSSREIVASFRHRTASLHLEAAGPGAGHGSLSLDVADRDARRFSPAALARRLADLLLVADRGSAPHEAGARDRGDFLLAPEVAVGLLAALKSLWIGPRAGERVAAMLDRRGRIGSDALSLIDNGRLPGGILEAPLDGEGQPTREVVLVEQGGFRQPLVAWWQTSSNPKRASGCALRPGWRDLPLPGPTHLYLQPDPSIRVASLLEDLGRGYYLIHLAGAPRIESDFRRFAAPVSGFAVTRGRPTGPVAGVWLVGSVAALLSGIVAKARDLTFSPVGGGMVGSPTLLVKGLELRRQL